MTITIGTWVVPTLITGAAVAFFVRGDDFGLGLLVAAFWGLVAWVIWLSLRLWGVA